MPPLSNTEVFYIPLNTTSQLQPCDAGINRSFKAYCLRNFHQRLLENIENGIVDPMKVDMLEAIKMCIEAWGNVKASTIRHCFQHCSITNCSVSTPILTADMTDKPALIQELTDQLAQFPSSNLMDINFLLNHPSERETYILPTDDEIIQHVSGQEQENLSSEEMMTATSPKKYLLRKFSNYLI